MPAEPVQPKLYAITGIMAAGKSTVAQALAERFPRSAHVRGDTFRRAIVGGRSEMSPDPSEEALAQLRLRYTQAVAVAERYVEVGFTTVLQDVFIGPIFDEVIDLITVRPAALIVLAPASHEVERRELARAKTGYGEGFTPDHLDAVLRQQTSRRGLWLDSTDQTVTQTVDAIVARAPTEAVL